MSGYHEFFERGSQAQEIAMEADATTEAAADGLRAPAIPIPLEGVLAEQTRFSDLSAQGHRGTADLYVTYADAEMLDRDAQLNYDMFRDAAFPAETSAHRFVEIQKEANFQLSAETVDMMTGNDRAEGVEGAPLETSPLQDGVTEGAAVTVAAAAVTDSRRAVRTAHIGIKENLLDVKKKLFEEKKEAKEDELEEYEAKIERVGQILELVGLLAGGASTAASLVSVGTAAEANTADQVGAGVGAGSHVLSVVQFGADLAMGNTREELETEIKSHAMFVAGIASMSGGLEAARNLFEFTDALATYKQARANMQIAVETRRKQYAKAGMMTDDRLIGTPDESEASRALLWGSAAQEARVFLDAAIIEHDVAKKAVDAAKANAETRKRTWYYRDEGAFYSYESELEKQELGGGPDVPALVRMGNILLAWKKKARTASAYLDQAVSGFETSLLEPAGGGGVAEDADGVTKKLPYY
jgi:hypothetical protein